MNTPVKSTQRTLDILEVLGKRPRGMSLTEVSRALHIPKSSALQILRTLENREYVARDPATNHFLLDARIFQLGHAYAQSMDLVREGQRVICELSRSLDETCHLAVLEGLDVVYVAKEESSQPMRMVTAVGRRVPAHATGVGKMLLAMLSERVLDARLKGVRLARLTPLTIGSVAALKAELRVTRDRCFSFDSGESTRGLHCLAAPVMDRTGQTTAAISGSVPVVRLPAIRRLEVLWRVCEAARRLSRRLGYGGGYYGAMGAGRRQLQGLLASLSEDPIRQLAAAD